MIYTVYILLYWYIPVYIVYIYIHIFNIINKCNFVTITIDFPLKFNIWVLNKLHINFFTVTSCNFVTLESFINIKKYSNN